jgi:hypothetical protein
LQRPQILGRVEAQAAESSIGGRKNREIPAAGRVGIFAAEQHGYVAANSCIFQFLKIGIGDGNIGDGRVNFFILGAAVCRVRRPSANRPALMGKYFFIGEIIVFIGLTSAFNSNR